MPVKNPHNAPTRIQIGNTSQALTKLPTTTAATAHNAQAPPREKSRLSCAITKQHPMDAIIVTQACDMILVKLVAVKNFPLVVAANMMNRPISPKNGISFLMAAPDFCSFFSDTVLLSFAISFYPPSKSHPNQITFSISILSVRFSSRANWPFRTPSFIIRILSDIPSNSGISSDTMIIDFPSEIRVSINW